jgi:flagellar assembly protein FliH
MGLIKSDNAPPTLSPFSMRDIESQANAIIVRAKQQAARILAEAQRIGEGVKLEAQQQGAVEGRAIGLQEGTRQGLEAGKQQALAEHRESLTKLVSALTTAATEIDASRRQLESQAASDVVRLAVAIARKVTHRAALDPAVMTANVSEAMRLAIRASDVRIAVHPSQRKALDDALPSLRMNWPALKHVELVNDDTLAPGGCRIFTGGGVIDADLNGKIDRIAAELLPE